MYLMGVPKQGKAKKGKGEKKMTNTKIYDYRTALVDDICMYLAEHDFDPSNYGCVEEAHEAFYDDMFVCDYVTGNASGSYTFNAWQAEENLSHNWDLMIETAENFGIDCDISNEHSAEYWDVSIRCYLLGEVLYEVLEGLF